MEFDLTEVVVAARQVASGVNSLRHLSGIFSTPQPPLHLALSQEPRQAYQNRQMDVDARKEDDSSRNYIRLSFDGDQ